MKINSSFLGKIGLFSFLLLAGCAVSTVSPARYAPRPDGNYDNHPFLVDTSQMDLARVMASFVTLYTETKFEAQDGEVIESRKVGSGIILDGRYVLTVEHVIAQHELSIDTPFGTMKVPLKRKISEDVSFRWKGKSYPLRTIYKDKKEDVALLEIVSDINPPSFPYRIGNSDELHVGNFVYVIGNPLSVGINVREGIVSARQAPSEATSVGVNPLHGFMVSNGLMPGDSGSPIIGIRDGNYELVGISQGTITSNTRLSWGIRINVIRNLLQAAKATSSDKWKLPEKGNRETIDNSFEAHGPGLFTETGRQADRLVGSFFSLSSLFGKPSDGPEAK